MEVSGSDRVPGGASGAGTGPLSEGRDGSGMEIRINSAGRVQPIEYKNLAQPGTCLLCNRIGRRPNEIFATLNVELEFYGIAYLCLDCCAELADFIMFKSPDHYRSLETRVTELSEENLKLRLQVKEAKDLINARIDSAGDSGSSSDGIAGLSFPDLESLTASINQDPDRSEPITT